MGKKTRFRLVIGSVVEGLIKRIKKDFNMKKIIFTLILLFIIIFGQNAGASFNIKPGIKPNSIFYVFDVALERIGLFLAFKDITKTSRAIKYADEKLAEANAVLEEGSPNHTIKAFKKYEEYMLLAFQKSIDAEDDQKKTELLVKINEATSRHQEVLNQVFNKVPSEAKEVINKVIEMSKKGREEAIKHTLEIQNKIQQLQDKIESLKGRKLR